MKCVNTFDAITISTSITEEQMKKAKRYAPACLQLKDEKGKPYFAIDQGNGQPTEYGISFNSVAPDGTMYTTLTAAKFGEKTPEAAKATLEDDFGTILYNLRAVEAQVVEAIGVADTKIASVQDAIVIM